MAGFYYFVPDVTVSEANGITAWQFQGTPLQHLFENRTTRVPDEVVVHWEPRGPDGNKGTLLYRKPAKEVSPPFCFYNPDSQDWWKFEDVWIGKESINTPPKAAELAKRNQVPGIGVADASGQHWCIPVCRPGAVREMSLPQVYGYDDFGNPCVSISNKFKRWFDLAGKAASHITGAEKLSDEEFLRLSLEFLQINYYVGPIEIFGFMQSEVEVFSPEFLSMVVGVAANWPAVAEYETQKKTDGQAHLQNSR